MAMVMVMGWRFYEGITGFLLQGGVWRFFAVAVVPACFVLFVF
jgi:hypothetical protein